MIKHKVYCKYSNNTSTLYNIGSTPPDTGEANILSENYYWSFGLVNIIKHGLNNII